MTMNVYHRTLKLSIFLVHKKFTVREAKLPKEKIEFPNVSCGIYRF